VIGYYDLNCYFGSTSGGLDEICALYQMISNIKIVQLSQEKTLKRVILKSTSLFPGWGHRWIDRECWNT
jgi:hypothetical protein